MTGWLDDRVGAQRRLARFGATLVLFLCDCATLPAPRSSLHPKLNGPAPAFDHTTMAGARLDSTQLRGRVWVVDFFANYCAPCHERFAALKDLGKGARMVGVALDEHEAQARLQVRRFKLPFEVIHDPGHVLAGRFRVLTLPSTFVVNALGNIVWVADAGMPLECFNEGIRQIISTATHP